jgi:hypothetical protein
MKKKLIGGFDQKKKETTRHPQKCEEKFTL